MIHFNIRLIRQGDRYGLNDRLTHTKDESMVEFYDPRYPRYPHSPLGQFVARYYVSTILGITSGLTLDASVPAWSVSHKQMIEIQQTVRAMLAGEAA